MRLGKVILEPGAAKMLRQRGVKLTGTAGAVIPQEDAEDFYALWQGQGQITLLEANTRYVADDLTLRGTDAMLKLRGERYVAGNLTLMDTVTPAHLAGMGRLWVTGTLMLPEALLDTVLPRLANEPELAPYQGKLLVDEEKMELGEAELSAYTQGVTLLVQGQLDLREDLAPEVLREKVRLLYNCGQVILNAEQQAALLPVTINQGHLSLRKAEEKTQPQTNPDECVLGRHGLSGAVRGNKEKTILPRQRSLTFFPCAGMMNSRNAMTGKNGRRIPFRESAVGASGWEQCLILAPERPAQRRAGNFRPAW